MIENKEYYKEIITNKSNCVEIQGYINEQNMDTILLYMKKHITDTSELEFWKVWLDEEIDSKFDKYESYQIDDLTAEKLLKLIQNATYPICLSIRK